MFKNQQTDTFEQRTEEVLKTGNVEEMLKLQEEMLNLEHRDSRINLCIEEIGVHCQLILIRETLKLCDEVFVGYGAD